MEGLIPTSPAIGFWADSGACATGVLRSRACDLDQSSSVRFGFGGDVLVLTPHERHGDFGFRVIVALALSRAITLVESYHLDLPSRGFIENLL